jgi:cytochrome c-type biogenesis protein CcmH/NrfF
MKGGSGFERRRALSGAVSLLGRAWLAVLLALSVVPLAAVNEVEDKAKFDAISDRFRCQCGCPNTVKTCTMLGCSFCGRIRPDIRQQVSAGVGVEEAVQALVGKYGVGVLSAPPTEGIWTFGWAMPFVAVLLGLIAAPIVAWRWKVKHDQQPPPAPVDEEVLARFQKQIDKDLAAME